MVRIGADDVVVTQGDAAHVAWDDRPAGETVAITVVHGARRSGGTGPVPGEGRYGRGDRRRFGWAVYAGD